MVYTVHDISEVHNLPIKDLIDVISSLTQSLYKAKRKNIHLKKLVNILENRLEVSPFYDNFQGLEE